MSSLYRTRPGQGQGRTAVVDSVTDQTDALLYDYSQIDNLATRTLAQQAASQIRPILRRTVVNAWTVGDICNRVKAQLPHGQFLEWAKAEFDPDDPAYRGIRISIRSLQRWMNLADQIALPVVQSSGMSLAGLLETTAPSTPEEVREQVLEAAQAGNPPTKAQVKKMKSAQETEESGGSQKDRSAMDASELVTITLRRDLAWQLLAYLQGDTALDFVDERAITRVLLAVLDDEFKEE